MHRILIDLYRVTQIRASLFMSHVESTSIDDGAIKVERPPFTVGSGRARSSVFLDHSAVSAVETKIFESPDAKIFLQRQNIPVVR